MSNDAEVFAHHRQAGDLYLQIGFAKLVPQPFRGAETALWFGIERDNRETAFAVIRQQDLVEQIAASGAPGENGIDTLNRPEWPHHELDFLHEFGIGSLEFAGRIAEEEVIGGVAASELVGSEFLHLHRRSRVR